MKRVIALCLVMTFTLGVMVPFATDWSEASKAKISKKKKKKIKKYSKAWWKMYRAKKRRARMLAVRRRALAKRRAEAVASTQNATTTFSGQEAIAKRGRSNTAKVPAQFSPTLGKDTPVAAGGSDLEFRVADQNGQQIGSAQLSVIGVAMPQNEEGASDKTRKQMLAGVPVSALRRTVIDRMIKENGWIVNDYQREVDGKRVFVVVAQSNSAGGATQSRQFYFTEVDGRIYSLATNAPSDYSDKVASDSEKLLKAMSHNNNRPTQTADLR
jgi:hypothetical protein